MEYGLDLSKHNGKVDFNRIKNAGNNFVIIRAGYGNTVKQKDPKFEEYYAQAKAAGLRVGAYWYSYALSSNEGITEAKACLEAIKGKTFDYPVYIDMEDADGYKNKHGMPSNDVLCDICNKFCEYVSSNGYHVGIYASESWFNNQLRGVSPSYDKWIALWGNNNGQLNSDKSSLCKLHQFTSRYVLDGKNYDRNVSYYNFSNTSQSQAIPTVDSSISTLELVCKTLRGEYGDGDTRKSKLGSRYNEVQSLINHIYSSSVQILVNETKAGKYGNGDVRKTVLGSRYSEVQSIINGNSKKSVSQIAKEVIRGEWGNGNERKSRLAAAGYNYDEVRKAVNKLMK